MSVLVAIKDKKRIVVGVDVRMSGGSSYVDSFNRRPKALHIDNKKDIIVGGVGNIALVDFFKEMIIDYSKASDVYEIDRSLIVRYIVPELLCYVKDYSLYDNSNKYFDGALFLAIRDKAYTIQGNYTVEEIDEYTAIGSGIDAAYGSLYTTKKFTLSPEQRIKIAIEATGSTINTVSQASMIGDTAGNLFRSS